jgi:iron complex transport system permease protein
VLLGVACLLTATAVRGRGDRVRRGSWRRTPPACSWGRSRRVLAVAALLVSVADTLGRTVIAPGQLPAGLLAALVGTPYFVWLLWRSRI